MSVTLTVNGTGYSFPNTADENWGDNVTNWASAVTSGMLQKAGGTFTLTSEINFGATYGLKTAYYKSQNTNPSATGIVRLGNTEAVSWRNAANTSDLDLVVNASNELLFNGTKLLTTGAGLITNADVSDTAVIAFSKMSALTADRVLVSDGSGVVSPSSVTTTTLAYLDATSSIQTQLDAKTTALTDHLSDTAGAHNASAITSVASGNLSATDVQAALNELQTDVDTRATSSALTTHTSDTANPHSVTKAQVGLSDVDNTSDATKNSAVATLTNKTIDADSNTLSNIANAQIKAAAGIAVNKLATLTASRAVVTDASGFVSASAVTSTELGYVSGVTSAIQTQINGLSFPAGTVSMYAGSSAPSGWLFCDGSAVSRSTYSALFTAISTTYGTGDGSTTFNLPDTRGIFVRGAGTQTISSINYTGTLGAKQGDQMQGHRHVPLSNTHFNQGDGSTTDTATAGANSFRDQGAQATTGNPTTDGTNGTPRTGSETRPANITFNYMIKT